MLKKIIIKNFQKIRKKVIHFDPHVTLLIGPNDKGKSATLRAIRWVLTNRPTGKSLIRRGSKQAEVVLQVDKHTIRRSIGATNTYHLDNERFKSFGTRTPDAIGRLANVSAINFQRQHEANFWFSLSPGQIAKELNKLVDLETIDRIQSTIAKRIRDKKAELNVCKQRLGEAKIAVWQLKWLDRFNVKMGKMGELDATICRMPLESHRIAQIERLLSIGIGNHTTMRAASNGAASGAGIDAASGRLASAGERISKLRQIVVALSRAGSVADRLPELPAYPKGYQQSELESLIGCIEDQKECLCQRNEQIAKRRKKLEDKLGGRCPTCGGLLTNQMEV
jgi:DNA repair exonuclease SbcCD ATPase subunit